MYGQVGYDAYRNHTGGKSLATGQDIPEWDALKPEIRQAWIVAGNAIAVAVRQEPRPTVRVDNAQYTLANPTGTDATAVNVG